MLSALTITTTKNQGKSDLLKYIEISIFLVNFLFISFVLIFICNCYIVSVFYKIISVLYMLQIRFLTYQMLLKLRKNSGGLVFVELPHFCGFYFQEPEQILKVNTRTKFPSVPSRRKGRAKATILKYIQRFSITKTCPPETTTLPEPHLTREKHNYPTPGHTRLLVQRCRKKGLKCASEGYSPETEAL